VAKILFATVFSIPDEAPWLVVTLQVTGAGAAKFWKAFDPQKFANIILGEGSLDSAHARRHKPATISID
jgi:hypothetical protein